MPDTLYTCNESTGVCDATSDSAGISLSECQAACIQEPDGYTSLTGESAEAAALETAAPVKAVKLLYKCVDGTCVITTDTDVGIPLRGCQAVCGYTDEGCEITDKCINTIHGTLAWYNKRKPGDKGYIPTTKGQWDKVRGEIKSGGKSADGCPSGDYESWDMCKERIYRGGYVKPYDENMLTFQCRDGTCVGESASGTHIENPLVTKESCEISCAALEAARVKAEDLDAAPVKAVKLLYKCVDGTCVITTDTDVGIPLRGCQAVCGYTDEGCEITDKCINTIHGTLAWYNKRKPGDKGYIPTTKGQWDKVRGEIKSGGKSADGCPSGDYESWDMCKERIYRGGYVKPYDENMLTFQCRDGTCVGESASGTHIENPLVTKESCEISCTTLLSTTDTVTEAEAAEAAEEAEALEAARVKAEEAEETETDGEWADIDWENTDWSDWDSLNKKQKAVFILVVGFFCTIIAIFVAKMFTKGGTNYIYDGVDFPSHSYVRNPASQKF